MIHASPFCRHFGIKLSTTERFVEAEIDNDGILHLDLRKTVTVSGPPRGPRQFREQQRCG